MSLNRQLWIAIVLLMVVIFCATFMIHGLASSRYLQQQITLKNHDDASALALSLSQQSPDSTMLEIQLSTLLDQGTYQRVSLVAPDGEVLFERRRQVSDGSTPGWIPRLFPVDAEPGRAEVSDGWTQVGTLSLESAEHFAYEELWESAKRTFAALLIATLLAGALGSAVLRRITRPLQAVVTQADNLSERRFTHLAEPYTTEFAQVTRAMNRVTDRVREMLDQSAERLTQERGQTDIDETTGLLLQGPLVDRLKAYLDSEDASSSGSLVLFRLERLAVANQLHGREAVDQTLRVVGQRLQAICTGHSGWVAGRVSGADLALIAPLDQDPNALAHQVLAAAKDALDHCGLGDTLSVPTSCSGFAHGDDPEHLLKELDAALLASLQTPQQPVTRAQDTLGRGLALDEESAIWRQRLDSALAEQTLDLTLYPVVSPSASLLHNEAMLRLDTSEEPLRAASILPWAYRLGLIPDIDRAVISRALSIIAQRQAPVCINLTLGALREADFLPWLRGKLQAQGDASKLLSVDISEASAFFDQQGFRQLRTCFAQFQVSVGLDHVGFRIEDVGLLSELGVDYLKVDGLFIKGIGENLAKRSLLQTYVAIAGTLGVDCIAEGVASAEDLEAVFACGARGATGPAVSVRGNHEA